MEDRDQQTRGHPFASSYNVDDYRDQHHQRMPFIQHANELGSEAGLRVSNEVEEKNKSRLLTHQHANEVASEAGGQVANEVEEKKTKVAS